MKVLFAVFTCNRLWYLQNCVNSILEFVDLNDAGLMILDNCTIERGIQEYMQTLPDFIIYQRFNDRVPNELYRAMNYSIQWCLDNKVPVINFVQDDYQYLYKIDDLVSQVTDVFNNNKHIYQLQTNMVWRHKPIGRYRIMATDKTNYAILQEKLLTDNGFTRVSAYRKTGMYPNHVISYDQNSKKTRGFGADRYKVLTNGELWFGNKCKKLGMKRALSLNPNMGMVFDCAYVRKKQRFGKYFKAPEKYYLKPLSEQKIEQIHCNNQKQCLSYIDVFCEPWGWIPSTCKKHNQSAVVEDIK